MTPMLTLNGTVAHVYAAPKGVNKSGEEYGGGFRVQLTVNQPLQNGEVRFDFVTLGTDQPDWFRQHQGEEVCLPVGAYSTKAGVVQFFLLKGLDLATLPVIVPSGTLVEVFQGRVDGQAVVG